MISDQLRYYRKNRTRINDERRNNKAIRALKMSVYRQQKEKTMANDTAKKDDKKAQHIIDKMKKDNAELRTIFGGDVQTDSSSASFLDDIDNGLKGLEGLL
jgi:hypothetical protein